MGWWLFAFRHPVAEEPLAKSSNATQIEPLPTEKLMPAPTLPDREQLRQALAGDTALMLQLIEEWDLDAELLQNAGFTEAMRLPRPAYLRSRLLGRLLLRSSQEELGRLREQARSRLVIDALGRPHAPSCRSGRYLPQTYASATFLLALLEPEQIIALPQGFREQKGLFSSPRYSEVPEDASRYQTEKLYLFQPETAFISHTYSHPDTIKALQAQGIGVFSHGDLFSVGEINEALLKIGHMTNRPLKAELLTLFMEAALLAIDNIRAVSKNAAPPERGLVVSLHHRFSLPGTRSLTHNLLLQMGIDNHALARSFSCGIRDWAIPVSEEQILYYNPDRLIVITEEKSDRNTFFQTHPALSAFFHKTAFLNEAVQSSPTQYCILGYYDLTHSLLNR